MSWAAHELESYFLQKHVGLRMSFSAVLAGCLLPDLFTKLPAYGLRIGDLTLGRVADPAQYHRGWPGAGFTHSLIFGVILALLVLAVTRSRAWSLGLLVGQWAHVLSDSFDTVGVMLFFPFSTQHYASGMWAYASHAGAHGDAAAYYSSLGGLWDLLWFGLVMAAGVFAGRHFTTTVRPADPVFGWIERRRFSPSPVVLRAIYRAFLVYGACRVFAWSLWARFLNPDRDVQVLDLSWSGPAWVEAISFPAASWAQFARTTVIGLTGLTAALIVIWHSIGRPLWARAA